jgi:hypothetical protein
MFGILSRPAEWRKFYAALIPVIALVVTYIWGEALGKKLQEVLMLIETVVIPVLVGAVPNK